MGGGGACAVLVANTCSREMYSHCTVLVANTCFREMYSHMRCPGVIRKM